MVSREELFKKKVSELVEFVIGKDQKYAGKEPCGNIKDIAKTWKIGRNPSSKWCSIRINEKVNRMRKNPDDLEVRKEELRDIWGYALEGLILIDMEGKRER